MKIRHLAIALILVAAAPAAAQVMSRPTDPPLVTAENESWFRLREPVQFAGDLYYPAGAGVFFNGNTMVRTGHYNGVPLYADTTLEPFSVIFVPMRRGVLQPYERLRRGDLAGTTGSRTPSFPVRLLPDRAPLPVAPGAPTAAPQPLGAISVFTPEPSAQPADRPVTTAAPAAVPPPAQPLSTLLRPESNDGIWLPFMGERWISAGRAVPLEATEFVRVGDYEGFPVYARAGLREDAIYLPTREDLVAPYRLKQ